jgi:hypothetical protein
MRIRFRRRGDQIARIDEKLDEAEKTLGARVAAVNDDYAFELSSQAPSSPFVLDHITPHILHDEMRKKLSREASMALGVAWRLYDVRLADLVREPEFQITRIERVGPSFPFVRISFDYAPTPGRRNSQIWQGQPTPVRGGYFTLDPDNSWAVTEFDVDLDGEDPAQRCMFLGTYEATQAGIPKIIEAEVRTGNLRGSHVRHRLEFEEFAFDETPWSEFRIPAYGLREPELRKPRWGLQAWIITIVLSSTLLLVAAFVMSRRVQM